MSANFEKVKGDRLTVAEALVQVLVEAGIQSVYGVSGANIENFHDAIYRRQGDLRSIAARSESGAAFMADGEARTGAPFGVCCSTSGGGMMNLAVGVAESYQEGIPVLAIVGQIPTRLEGMGGFQDSSGMGQTVHALGLWKAISKVVREIRSGASFWDDLKTVMTEMLTPRRGPGVLLIPKDIFDAPVPPRPEGWHWKKEEKPKENFLRSTRRTLEGILSRSERPVMIVGAGVGLDGARDAVVEFARCGQIPVVTTLSDLNAFPNDDPLYLGTIGTAGHPSAHDYLNHQADCLVLVGTQLEVMLGAPVKAAMERCGVVVVDSSPHLQRKAVPGAVSLTAPLARLFSDLCEHGEGQRFGNGRPENYQLECFLPQLVTPVDEDVPRVGPQPLRQSEAIQRIQSILPEKGSLVFDAGNCAASSLHYLAPPRDLKTTIALGMGGMGYAIAAGVGTQLAGDSDSKTMVLCGDGAFLLLGMEVHTAVDLGIPMLVVVFNNAQHGMCVTRQQLYFENRIECAQYARPSIAQIGRGFGTPEQIWVGAAETVQELDEQLEKLREWNWKGPALLEVVIRVEEMPPFTPFLDGEAPKGHWFQKETTKRLTKRHVAA